MYVINHVVEVRDHLNLLLRMNVRPNVDLVVTAKRAYVTDVLELPAVRDHLNLQVHLLTGPVRLQYHVPKTKTVIKANGSFVVNVYVHPVPFRIMPIQPLPALLCAQLRMT